MKAKMVHICFEVSDLDRAVAFYARTPGLQEAGRMGRYQSKALP